MKAEGAKSWACPSEREELMGVYSHRKNGCQTYQKGKTGVSRWRKVMGLSIIEDNLIIRDTEKTARLLRKANPAKAGGAKVWT